MQATIDFVTGGYYELDAKFVMYFFCFCIALKGIILIANALGSNKSFR
jgi:hypothetical protein